MYRLPTSLVLLVASATGHCLKAAPPVQLPDATANTEIAAPLSELNSGSIRLYVTANGYLRLDRYAVSQW